MGTSIVIAVGMNGSIICMWIQTRPKGKIYAQRKKKGGININLEIGGNSQTMFHLPIDQAEPYNLNFEAQMHQSLNNKQHVLEVTYPVMFCTISVSSYQHLIGEVNYCHKKNKSAKLRINTTTPRK